MRAPRSRRHVNNAHNINSPCVELKIKELHEAYLQIRCVDILHQINKEIEDVMAIVSATHERLMKETNQQHVIKNYYYRLQFMSFTEELLAEVASVNSTIENNSQVPL